MTKFYHLTSHFVASLASQVTFPESPTASKENFFDQEYPGSLSLAYKNEKQNYFLIARVLTVTLYEVLLKGLRMH